MGSQPTTSQFILNFAEFKPRFFAASFSCLPTFFVCRTHFEIFDTFILVQLRVSHRHSIFSTSTLSCNLVASFCHFRDPRIWCFSPFSILRDLAHPLSLFSPFFYRVVVLNVPSRLSGFHLSPFLRVTARRFASSSIHLAFLILAFIGISNNVPFSL
jgi:hypothetical protein